MCLPQALPKNRPPLSLCQAWKKVMVIRDIFVLYKKAIVERPKEKKARPKKSSAILSTAEWSI